VPVTASSLRRLGQEDVWPDGAGARVTQATIPDTTTWRCSRWRGLNARRLRQKAANAGDGYIDFPHRHEILSVAASVKSKVGPCESSGLACVCCRVSGGGCRKTERASFQEPETHDVMLVPAVPRVLRSPLVTGAAF
jgi:hypothetical protein